jgi:choice-of-anchor A domain-containing protein
MSAWRLAALLPLLLLAAPSQAAPMTGADILAQFNAVIRGNFASRSDVEGRTVVGGNVTQGATFFNNPGAAAPSSSPALTVYGTVGQGNLNLNNGGGAAIAGSNQANINMNGGGTLTIGGANSGNINVNGGSAAIAGANSGNINANGGTVSVGSPVAALPGFQATFVDPLLQLSEDLAALSPNSLVPATSAGWPNNVPLTASAGSGLAVFNVTTTYLSSLASFTVELNGRSGAVFNVYGTSYTGNANYNNAVAVANNVIWNFVDATSIAFNRQWGGTVLAPLAHVTNGTPIEGTLFANSYGGTGELHSRPFTAELPDPGTTGTSVPVPAPGGLLLFGLGMAALAGLRARRA